MNRSNFAERHPYSFAALMVLTAVAGYMLAGTAAALLKLPMLALYGGANLVLTLTATGVLTLLGWWREAWFCPQRQPRDLLLFWLPLAPVLLNLAWGVRTTDLRHIAIYLAISLMVGFVEEAFFRGLVLRALLPRGMWRAVIVSSLLFGLMHSMNIASGSAPSAVLLQIGYASAIGFCYAALVLRTGTILPLVIIHFLTDFANFVANDKIGRNGAATSLDAVITVVIIAAFTAYGAYLLRPARRPAALAAAQS